MTVKLSENIHVHRHAPRIFRTVSLILISIGILVVLFGISLYMLGYFKIGFMFDVLDKVILTSRTARLTGLSVPRLEQLVNQLINNATLVSIIGLVFLFNGIMLKIQSWERFKDYLCVQPVLLFFLFVVYYPFAELIRISFTNWNLQNDAYAFVGFKNYNWLLYGSGWKYLMESLRITLLYTFWEIVIVLGVGFLLAFLFNRITKLFSVLRAIVFLPRYVMLSSSAIVFVWILSSPNGIFNYLLSLFGITGTDWIYEATSALTSVLILSAWRMIGYAMMIYFYAIQSIPKTYYEAATVDGADSIHRFRFITLPLLKPTTLFLLITTFISCMKSFDTFSILTNGGPHDATNVIVHWVHQLAFEDNRIDRASAVSVLFFLVLFVFTLATMHFTNRTTAYNQENL